MIDLFVTLRTFRHARAMRLALACFLLAVVARVIAEPTNLVANGSFAATLLPSGAPRHWSTSGNASVHQLLAVEPGPDGRPAARLVCTRFDGDGPDFHAMLCQVNQVSVRAGQWYRLSFQARTAELKAGSVEVALVNTAHWENAGLAEAFPAITQWTPFEFVFRAPRDLPAASSRLQFWFKSTGTLWLANVVLEETTAGQQWYPQIPTEGVKNLIPNSSFECGGANWGSLTWGLSGWAGNLYRLEGSLDSAVAQHGRHSLRIALEPDTRPVFCFDYYEPVRQAVPRVLAANQGWLVVEPGRELTLSAFLRADADGVAAQLAAVEAPSRISNRAVTVGTQWTRRSFTFTPTQSYVFIAVGLDLEESKRSAATLWVDAVQLERGAQATAYAPRQPLEAFLDSEQPGHLFTDLDKGAQLRFRAFNDSDTEQRVRRFLKITDFFDRSVVDRDLEIIVPAHQAYVFNLDGVCSKRRGFFRAFTTADAGVPGLRFAVIEPIPPGTLDSPFGFNHAYPWDWLVQLARQSGIVWWRDWSAKWQTVEPEAGRFDFSQAEAQIRRVQGLDSQVEVLLPFPSAAWSTTAKPDEVEKAAGGNSYLRARLPFSYAPKQLADFGRYAAEVVRHYREPAGQGITTYQILNEPIYTDYALPSKFGYGLDDYLRLLQVAFDAIKQVDPQARVVGGLSAHLQSAFTRDFVTRGGLRFLDIFDLHLYDPARPAESFLEPFRSLQELMTAHGGPKPVWITEWGCYADDDPACVPQTVGDATMNRCRWSSERAATEHLVKFAAVAMAHGVRKIFFHAGTCGTINGPDAGGVLFEYGGAPRKMLPGVAAFTRLVGVPDKCVQAVAEDGLHAFVFQSGTRICAVAWNVGGPRALGKPPGAVRICDIMGNPASPDSLVLDDSPLFIFAPAASDIRSLLPASRTR